MLDNIDFKLKENSYTNKDKSIFNIAITISCIILVNILNPIISIMIYIGLIKYSMNDKVKAIKALIISFTIFFLNPGIFHIDNSIVPNLRWIIFFSSLFTLINKTKKITLNKEWLYTFIVWVMFVSVVSILNSNLPLVSLSKLFMFSLGFIAINIGVSETNNTYNWKKWIFAYCLSIQYLSLPFLFLPSGYFINGTGFQGITNQPNAFGIITAVMISIYIFLNSQLEFKKYSKLIHFSIFMSIVMLISSKSRTSMLALILSLVIYFFIRLYNSLISRRVKLKSLVIIIFFIVISSIFITFNYENICNQINELLFKGGYENILFSSQSIIEAQNEAILNSPIIGNGFGVEWNPNQGKSLNLSLSYPVEKRNLLLALMSETGMIGTVIFAVFLLKYTNILKYKKFTCIECIFISAIMINFGEMVFFSGNGIGIFIWFILAFYNNQKDIIIR